MLTAQSIRDMKPTTQKRYDWDKRVVGLGVRITPAGAKTYVLRYRVNGRQRIASLARTSVLTLKEARLLAGDQLTAIRSGKAIHSTAAGNSVKPQRSTTPSTAFLTTFAPAASRSEG